MTEIATMGLQTIEPAAALPVTLEEARTFARVVHDDEDQLLGELIAAATDHVQQATDRQFVPSTFRYTQRAFPIDSPIRLPIAPVLSVASVTVKDRDGAESVLEEGTDYLVDLSAAPVTIEPIKRWPLTGHYPDAVSIVFEAGYPPSGDSPPNPAANVPPRAKAAIKALVSWWFEQREPAAFAAMHTAPYHVQRLLHGLKVWR